MEYIIIGVLIIIALIIGTIFCLKIKQNKKFSNTSASAVHSLLKTEPNNSITIPMEILPIESISDNAKLVEITDNKILAQINNLVPGFVQAGNGINNAVQAIKSNGEVLYRAIIPPGAKLANSKSVEGAVRGFYQGANGNIKGQANFVSVNMQKGTSVIANTATTVMGVAAMVVGQYYMAQINTELGLISDGISQIQNFQNNEYRSRVFSLITHMKKISDFKMEILENKELCLLKISQLDNLEEECTQLLGQANLTLAEFAKKTKLHYAEYEDALESTQNWFMYQKTLLDVLYEISDLKYTLHFGTVSREQCSALLPTYTKQVSDTQERLTTWHKEIAMHLGIDTSESRRKRTGMSKIIGMIPSIFNDDYKFCEMEKKTINMIETQKAGYKEKYQANTSELYDKDVQLISKNGKIYYLPEDE